MLKQRILTALVLLALFIPAALWLPPTGWAALISVIIGLAAWEWAGLAGYGKRGRIRYGVYVAALLFGLSTLPWYSRPNTLHLFGSHPYLLPLLVFWFVVIPLWLWLRFRWPLKGIPGLLVGLIALLPAGFMVASVDVLASGTHGIYDKTTLLGILTIAWVADTCAYFTGRKFGRHKLAPGISPGKTWEGVAGAVAGVFLYLLALLLPLFLQLQDEKARELFSDNFYHPLVFLGFRFHGAPFVYDKFAFDLCALTFAIALVLTAVSVIGDLFESLLKRQAGVKDSSSLLPGHGAAFSTASTACSPCCPSPARFTSFSPQPPALISYRTSC